MGHATEKAILITFCDMLSDLNENKMIQVSMDGLKTNWIFFKIL